VPVRLNITIDEDLYRRLKKELPPKGISSFIEASVRARLFPGRMGDQIRSIDKSRLKSRIGTLRRDELLGVEDAVRITLELSP
jgi:hypothetical protein